MFSLSAFLSYVFVMTFTPGPNNIMSMSNASKFGYKQTLRFMLGIATGFFIIMLFSSYFNLFLFNLMPKVKTFMGILGAVYMSYLAIKIIKTKKNIDENNNENLNEDNKAKSINKLNSFFTGMTMQIINPKVIIYGLTIMSTFIIPYYKTNLTLTLFSFFLAFMAFVSISCWALFGSLFKKFLYKYDRQFSITMALLLIYSAISISGITHIFH